MSETVKISDRATSREVGRAVARSLPTAGEVELELDREPSLSFLDGLVRELRERGRLGCVTFVRESDLVRRHLGRFVAHEPTMEIWVRTSSGSRARVELPDEERVEIEGGPIGDDVGLG